MGRDTKIILAIIVLGLTLAGLLLQQTGGIRTDVANLRDDVANLRERVSRIETLLEYALPQPADPPSERMPGE